jgi:hypothetical protein
MFKEYNFNSRNNIWTISYSDGIEDSFDHGLDNLEEVIFSFERYNPKTVVANIILLLVHDKKYCDRSFKQNIRLLMKYEVFWKYREDVEKLMVLV